MLENMSGLVKIIGISVLLIFLWVFLNYQAHEEFTKYSNIENLLRRTALYGILGIGVAFVIISSGIDLSIGSLVCLSACLLAILLQVTYSPLEQTDVWALEKESKTILVSSDLEYEVGQRLWLEAGRREKRMIQVVAVEKNVDLDGKSLTKITLEKAPRKDQKSEEGKPVGTLSRAYPLSSVESETQFSLEDGSILEQMAPKDRVILVHPTKSKRERAVGTITGSSIELASSAKDLDAEYAMIPIKRQPRMSIPMAVLSVCGIALVLGFIHGILITKLKQRPFIVTLCGLLIYRSISRWLTNDQTVGFIEYSDSLGWLASGRWILWESAEHGSFGIPYTVFFLIAIAILAIVFLNFTIWGRYIMALGRNEEAARYSGVNTDRMTILAYVICAFLAGVGGMLHAIDSNSIAPSSYGNFFELYAIAAAVLGGCSLRGGEGSIIGVIVGTALMQTLYNLIILMKISDELEFTIIGAVILIGTISDEVVRKIGGRLRKKV